MPRLKSSEIKQITKQLREQYGPATAEKFEKEMNMPHSTYKQQVATAISIVSAVALINQKSLQIEQQQKRLADEALLLEKAKQSSPSLNFSKRQLQLDQADDDLARMRKKVKDMVGKIDDLFVAYDATQQRVQNLISKQQLQQVNSLNLLVGQVNTNTPIMIKTPGGVQRPLSTAAQNFLITHGKQLAQSITNNATNTVIQKNGYAIRQESEELYQKSQHLLGKSDVFKDVPRPSGKDLANRSNLFNDIIMLGKMREEAGQNPLNLQDEVDIINVINQNSDLQEGTNELEKEFDKMNGQRDDISRTHKESIVVGQKVDNLEEKINDVAPQTPSPEKVPSTDDVVANVNNSTHSM